MCVFVLYSRKRFDALRALAVEEYLQLKNENHVELRNNRFEGNDMYYIQYIWYIEIKIFLFLITTTIS